jgi:membrane protein DedA with SNARE-associated domain/membrane-associated phospholipid phosphatase
MIASVSSWVLSLSGGWALAIVFLGPALESSAFVGFLFPGEIAVVLGGVLAYQGRVPLAAAILAAVLGAIVGDTVGYWVGRRWGHQILRGIGRRIPLLRHRVDEHLETARAYLTRRGGVAVLVGRFTAALRVMVPGLAGMSDMHYPTFFAFNAVGGALWGTAFVLVGYFAGAAWERVAGYASKAGLGLLALVVVALVVARILRNVREHGESLADRAARIRPVARLRRTFPRASAWFAARIDTSSPRGFALSLAIAAGAFSAWLFGGLMQDVLAHEEAVRYDPGILRFVVSHREGWLTAVMKGVTWLGSDGVLIPLVLIVALWCAIKRRSTRSAIVVAAALAGANVLYRATKALVARPRPPVSFHLVQVGGHAFPSGHATQVVAAWGAIALVMVSGRSARTAAFAWIAVAVVSLLVGASRIYLGVHWWTDVIAGFALGATWLSIVWALGLWIGRPRRETETDAPPERIAA